MIHQPGNQPHYIISPGMYTYPFQFKVKTWPFLTPSSCPKLDLTAPYQIPFNNSCSEQTPMQSLNFGGLIVDMARPPTQHVKATLPPSIYYPGEAEIRYYVKVTVNRPSILKENPRQVSLIKSNHGVLFK
jgi:hypothetical protein